MAGPLNTITINFPSQITKIESEIFPGGEITSSGLQVNSAADGGIYTLTCTVKNGYKISNCVYSNAGNAELRGFTDTTITLKAGTDGYGLGGTLDISVAQVAQKAISLSNLEKFKELCDQTYAKTGGSGGGSGGGTQWWKHVVRVVLHYVDTGGKDKELDLFISFINSSNTPITTQQQLFENVNLFLYTVQMANAAGDYSIKGNIFPGDYPNPPSSFDDLYFISSPDLGIDFSHIAEGPFNDIVTPL